MKKKEKKKKTVEQEFCFLFSIEFQSALRLKKENSNHVVRRWLPLQVKKTWGATLSTLQDMTVLDDCDVSQSFTHSPSSESVKSSVSDGYLNKPSLAKRRANQQETELFYFNVRARRRERGGGLCPL